MSTTIVNFLTKNEEFPVGDERRNAAYMCGHMIFFTFNFINFVYINFYEGYAYGRLKHNTLTKAALLGVFLQMLSCFTSIRRLNANDEFGIDAKIGTVLGLLSFFAINVGYLHILLHKNYKKYLTTGIMVWLAVVLVCSYLSFRDWDEKNFAYFRVYISLSVLFHVVSNIFGMNAHKRGDINIDESILSHGQMNRVFQVSIFLEASILIATGVLGMPMVTYPGSGATFSIFVILSGYVGRMDYLTGGSSEEIGSSDAADNNPLQVDDYFAPKVTNKTSAPEDGGDASFTFSVTAES